MSPNNWGIKNIIIFGSQSFSCHTNTTHLPAFFIIYYDQSNNYNPGKTSWYLWPFLTISPFPPTPRVPHRLPPPPPPFPLKKNNVESVCSKCPLWETLYEGKGEGNISDLTRHSHHRTRSDDENIANFQSVPHTFDQDCRMSVSPHCSESHSRPVLCAQNNDGHKMVSHIWHTQNAEKRAERKSTIKKE